MDAFPPRGWARLARMATGVLLAASAALASAQVEVRDVQELKGRWLVTGESPNFRERLLEIDAVEPDGPSTWRIRLRHSFAENTPKPIPPGRLTRENDQLVLDYQTATDAAIRASYTRSGVFEGSFTSRGGKAAAVLVSPLTDDEFEELRQAQVERRQAVRGPAWDVRPGSRVELIYLESTNYSCPFCRHWEREWVNPGKLRNTPEGRELVLTRVGTGRYITDGFLPENLRPHRAMLESRARNLFRATPSFIVMVDGRPVSWGVGLSGWDRRVHPDLRRIAELRAAAR